MAVVWSSFSIEHAAGKDGEFNIARDVCCQGKQTREHEALMEERKTEWGDTREDRTEDFYEHGPCTLERII